MKLTRHILGISKKYPTPFIIMDMDQVQSNYRKIKASINGVEVFYAVKANDDIRILEALTKEGSSFEISSLDELKKLIKLHVPASQIVCFNPIKNSEFLQELSKYGVEIMAFDSTDEIDKIAKYAPRSKVVLRIIVDNEGSDWPLTKKFGVDAADALPLLKYAIKKKVTPIGLTFHVGSQCLNRNNWVSALYVCHGVWNKAKDEGMQFNFLSLGGGLPIKHIKSIPTIKSIGSVINKVLATNFKSAHGPTRIAIEPGRGMVGDAAIMVTKVIGRAKRGIEDWIYIDAGVFNGLMETIANFQYEIKTENGRKKKLVTIGGPSCDSVDIPFKNIPVPGVKTGEYLYIINAGAYTTVYASNFNGFAIPKIYFLK